MSAKALCLTGLLIVPFMLTGCTDPGPTVGDGLDPAQACNFVNVAKRGQVV